MKKQNYDKLYKKLEKEKNPEKGLKIADEIIKNRPYFRNPYLYIYKIKFTEQILLKKFKKTSKDPLGKLWKSKAYRTVVKENVDNYLFSYYINVNKPTPTNEWKEYYGEKEVIFEHRNYYPEKDEWKLIKLLKMLYDQDIKDKVYLWSEGDSCNSYLDRLLEIYYTYGEEKKNTKHLEAQSWAYAGYKKYVSNFDSDDDYALKELGECKYTLEKALTYEPDNAIANYVLGRFYYELEKSYDKALMYLGKVEENYALIWEAYYYLGKIYVKKSNFEKAKDYYKFALSIYDEDGQAELIEEMVEDISVIGGCRQELLEALEQKFIQEEKVISPNIKIFKTNKHLLDDKTKEECEIHLKSFQEEFPVSLWNTIDNYSRELLSCAETAYYCGSKSVEYFRPSFAIAYLYYFQSLENEILTKIFLPFKMNEWSEAPIEEKRFLSKLWFDQRNGNDKRKADNMRKAVQFLSDEKGPWKKIDRPTLGQMLGIVSLDIKDNPAIKKFRDFVLYRSPLLVDDKFFGELDSLNKDRNKIHSIIDIKKSFVSHFQHFRDIIIGTKEKKGLLIRFLESVELK